MRIEFPTPLRVAVNPETGEVFIVPTEREIDQSLELARRDFEEGLASRVELLERKGYTQEQIDTALDKERETFANRQKTWRERRLAEVTEVAPYAKVYQFSLVRPNHGQHESIMQQVAGLNPDVGTNLFDNVAYRTQLLRVEGTVKLDGRVLPISEVNELDPVISAELVGRLIRSLNVDPKRMVFTKPV